MQGVRGLQGVRGQPSSWKGDSPDTGTKAVPFKKFLTGTVQRSIVQSVNEVADISTSTKPLWKLILHASERVETAFETGLAPIGLSLSKLGVLKILISEGDSLPLSRLASRLSCVKSNVTQLVDRLEADGLVARINDASDRRSVLASITDAGRAKFTAGAEIVASVEGDLFGDLSAGDRQVVEAFLARLADEGCKE